jgi:two-component system sensor histidine kinase KdpD
MMKEIRRPNPDELLMQMHAEEEQKSRGKLKIFLGYAAGVGKTFAMLEAAQQRKEQGIDIAVGYIETHGRKDTEAKLAGIEVTPRRKSNYHGANLTEMDLDEVLRRHPQLVLVIPSDIKMWKSYLRPE